MKTPLSPTAWLHLDFRDYLQPIDSSFSHLYDADESNAIYRCVYE